MLHFVSIICDKNQWFLHQCWKNAVLRKSKANLDFRMISRLWMAISQRLGKIFSNFQKFVFSKNFNLDAGSTFRSIRAFSSLLEAHVTSGYTWSRICIRSKKTPYIWSKTVVNRRFQHFWLRRCPQLSFKYRFRNSQKQRLS